MRALGGTLTPRPGRPQNLQSASVLKRARLKSWRDPPETRHQRSHVDLVSAKASPSDLECVWRHGSIGARVQSPLMLELELARICTRVRVQ